MNRNGLDRDGFVADGKQRVSETLDFRSQEQAVRLEVRAAFEERIRKAGPVRAFFLERKCDREIARRLRALLPGENLYMMASE